MRRRGIRSKKISSTQPEGYFLDEFSQANLKQWNKFSNILDEYHIRLFYHLEGLRESHKTALTEALISSKLKAFNEGSWCRFVSFQYSDVVLSTKGSLISGGRFNIGSGLDPRSFPSFPVLYLAEDQGA